MPNEPQHALFRIQRPGRQPEEIPVEFNPTELSFTKAAQIAEIGIPGIDAPILQFIRGQAEKVTIELFFDTTDGGMDGNARSVTELTDRFMVWSKCKVTPTRRQFANSSGTRRNSPESICPVPMAASNGTASSAW